jgi:hypothetical protein
LSGAISFVSDEPRRTSHRRLVGAVVAFLGERSLADVDDEECGVEPAVEHLGQVDLILEPLRVIPLGGEVCGADVVVGIERDHLVVNRARFPNQGIFSGRLSTYRPVGGGRGQRDRSGQCHESAGFHKAPS